MVLRKEMLRNFNIKVSIEVWRHPLQDVPSISCLEIYRTSAL